MPPGERYSAIERGIADGAAHSIEGQYNAAYYDLIDYFIDHGTQSTGEAMGINLDTWNNLPEHLETLLTDVMLELEVVSEDMAKEVQDDVKQGLIEGGMTPITFSPEDAKRFIALGFDAAWDTAFENHPELGPQTHIYWANP